MDGLEWGLLAAMGHDTAPVNPFPGHYRYDTMTYEYGAYTTDPTDDDTDGDTLLDGTDEDDDFDGYRDGNSPYDTSSDWGGAGETDPNVCDTDRGGVDDGAEVANGDDPLDNTEGDWDIDIDNDGADAVANVLDDRCRWRVASCRRLQASDTSSSGTRTWPTTPMRVTVLPRLAVRSTTSTSRPRRSTGPASTGRQPATRRRRTRTTGSTTRP